MAVREGSVRQWRRLGRVAAKTGCGVVQAGRVIARMGCGTVRCGGAEQGGCREHGVLPDDRICGNSADK